MLRRGELTIGGYRFGQLTKSGGVEDYFEFQEDLSPGELTERKRVFKSLRRYLNYQSFYRSPD